ncbi:hypothetical protein NDA16_004024 [Ustilago loliicola]|nr:hypothetical protein NDA16_004024 [Ustilago loliicola]
MQRRPSQTAASQLTKLDGVIYHFYTTTANLVIQSRLAHLRPLLLTTPPFDSTPSEQRPASAAGTSSQTKLSRWFGLHIPDSDLFKEELRFWRSVTTLMGLNSLDDEPSTGSSGVPDLVVDVLLDLSGVSERHEILILTSPSTSGSARFTQSNASSSCLCIDGRKPGEAASLQPSSRPQRIVLERWRLRFDSKQPSDPPDLSTFYKRSVVHFRTLFTILCSLPANRLSAKIEALKAATEDRGKFSHPSHPSLAAREDMGSYDAEMTVGCRLDMASDAEQVAPSLPEEINVTDALPAERNLSLSENDEAEPMSDDRITSHGHYATRTLPPIATPVGHLELSVTYRKLTGFSIEDAESLRNANDLKVDLDEDYFRTAQRAMSMQGSRAGGGQGLAPSTSQSVSSFRSVSGSGLRSSMSGTGVLTTPSLRSVFQTYVPRSQTVSTTSMARTPPTSTSVFTHGSYSPSNLGTGLRSSSVRRNSSTSDAGSGSAFGPSIASSSAAAAKPQMIKRYSTNFSYRQNRERSGIYGSSLGSEGSGSVGAGAEPSSFPRFGGGGSLSSAYGRSWVSRMEQRQGLGTGGAFARTSSLDDATAAATASSASRYRPVTGTSATHMGGLTPSPRSHDEDMDDLVRLLETRPALGTSSMGKLTSLRNERRNAPGLNSTPEEGGAGRAGPASDALTDSVQCNLGQDRPSSLSGSGLRSGAALRTANPMSRSQLDELLNRMAESVGILGSKEPSSSASGETSSDVAASDDTRNQAIPSAAPGAPARSSAPQNAPSTQPLTAAQIAATLGKGRGSQSKEAESAADTPAGRVSSPGTFGRAVSGDAGLQSRSAVGQQGRAYGTSAVRAASSSSLTTEQGARFSRDSAAIPSTTAVGPSIANSDQMPEYEAEGDLIFKVDGQPEYDPEDELPGEMEMVAEEVGPTGTAVRSADAVTSTFGGGVEGGMGATLPVGAHREGRTHDWHAADRWERERALEAERRPNGGGADVSSASVYGRSCWVQVQLDTVFGGDDEQAGWC